MLLKKDFWRRSEEERFKNEPLARILIQTSLISESMITRFRESNAQWSTFSTWGNSGIEPDEGTWNQLSRNYEAKPHVASQRRRAAMEYYVGLDVSLKQTSICV